MADLHIQSIIVSGEHIAPSRVKNAGERVEKFTALPRLSAAACAEV